jgi:tetratricopeptide (TPR) repeat protein
MKIRRHNVCTFFALLIVVASAALVYPDATLDQLIKSKKYADAVAYAESKLPSNLRTADVWVKLGIANEELGTIEKSLACFLVASRVDVLSYDAQLGIARVYNKLNQPENALTFAKKAQELQSTGEASWEYAKACIALKKPAEAKEAMEKVVETDPSNFTASRGLADIYWQEKEYKKAIPLLKMAFLLQPNADDAYKIGRALLEANKLDSAIFFLKEAITRNPGLYSANLDLARAYFLKDKFLAAANEYEKIAGKVKLSATDQYNRGVSQEKTGSMESAIKAYRAAAEVFGLDKSPEAVASHLKVGKADLEQKNYESALAHFRAIATIDAEGTRVPEIHMLLAEAYSGVGSLTKAIASLEKALSTDNNNVEAYARLADLYQKSGMPDKAKQIYDKITAISPNDPKIYVTLGDYSLKSKKYTDALKYFEKSYIIDRNVKAASGMALSAAALEQWEKAIDAAESAVRLDSSLFDARVVLAKAYFRTDRYRDAKQQLDFLVGKKPFELEYWKQLAICCKQLNDLVNMSYADKKIIEIDKGNVESRFRLGAYLLARREYKQAFDIYKELATLTPQSPDVFKSLYEITLNSGDKASAAGYLKKYIAFNPSDAVAQRNLGGLYYEVKNYDAALTAFRTAIKLDPTIKGVYKSYAEIVITKGLKEELGAALNGAISAGEADGTMYSMLGDVYQKQGSCQKAIELYQKALVKDPRNMPVLSGLARCQAKMGDIDGAIVTYEQVLAFNASAVDESKALGELYLKQNKEGEAVGVFKKYLDKNKDDPEVARLVGDYAFKQKNYEDAARYYNMVTGLDGKKTDFLLRFGQACYYAKNYLKASAILDELAALTPQNPEVFRLLYSIAQQDASKKNALLGYLKKYVALKPSDAAAQRSLGDALYDQKDTAKALSAYRRALAADPAIKGFFKRYFELASTIGAQADITAALNGAISAGEADADMYAAQGNIFQKQGLLPKAIQMYQKALATDPRNTAVLMSLANCQVKAGNMTEASVTYEQLLAFNPHDSRIQKFLGEMYLQQKKKDQAVAVFKKYLDLQPKDYEVAFVVGEYAYVNKNYDEAARYLAMVEGEKARTAAFLSMYGQACFQRKDYAKVKELYGQLALLTPQDPDIYKTLYTITSQEPEQKGSAATFLKKYVALKPADAGARKDLGDLLYERKDFPGSLAAYRKAIALDPSIKGFYKRYFEMASVQGLTEDASIALKGAIAAGEANARMYNMQAIQYQKAGMFSQAIQMFQKALSEEPKNTTLLMSMGACQVKAGDMTEASITYEQVVALNPQDARVYKLLGDMYLQQKKKDKAVSVFKKYLDIQPKDNEVAYTVGEYAYVNKNFNEASRYLEMVVGERARTVPFLSMYAHACFQKKDYPKAKELYNQLSLLTPQNPDIFKILYTIASQDPEQKGVAATCLKKYVALKPADAGARKDLGDLLYERKDFPGSFAAYRKAIALDPSIKGIYKRYFELASSQGSAEDVSIALKGAIAAGEADAGMYNIQATQYQKAGLFPQAIQMFQKALSTEPKNTALLMSLGACQVKAGSMTEASITYEQVLAVNPQEMRVYKMLGEMYLQQKKTDQAVTVYKKYLELQPKDYQIASFVAKNAYKAKNYDEAVRYFKMLGGEEARDQSALGMYANACLQKKDYGKAKELFTMLAAQTPTNPNVYRALYDIAVRDNDKETAISNLKKYLAIKPQDAQAQKEHADYLYDQKELSQAFYAYRAALAADPAIKGVYKRYSELVISRGTPEEVLTVLTNTVSAGEAVAQTYATLGSIYEKKSVFPKAIDFYNSALQLDHKNTQVLSSLARCQVKTGATSDAIVTYQQVVALNPDAVQEYKILGDLYLKQKKRNEALEAYRKYLTKAPGDAELAMLLADEAFKKKEYEETIKFLNQAQKEKGQDIEFLYLYGRSYYYAKSYKKSIEVFEQMRALSAKGAQKNTHNAVMLRMLADSYDKAGEFGNALNAYTAYTKLTEVNDPEASFRKAQLAESVNPALAARYYEENTAQSPGDCRNYFGAGLLFAKQASNQEKAAMLLRKGLSLKDTLPVLWMELGKMYGKLGKSKQELEAYQYYIQRDASNPDACEEIGVILLNKRLVNDAMVFLEMANALKENNPDFMFQLARGYLKTDRNAEALSLLEKTVKLKPNDEKIKSLYIFVQQKANSAKTPGKKPAARTGP